MHLHFTVSDTGIGIVEDRIEKIFRSFEQAYSDTSRKFGGTTGHDHQVDSCARVRQTFRNGDRVWGLDVFIGNDDRVRELHAAAELL